MKLHPAMHARLVLPPLAAVLVPSQGWAFFPSPGQQGSDPASHFFLMLLLFFGIIYFIVIRPQNKEQKRHRERVANLKRGDRVVTGGGLHGTVRTPKENTIILEIAPGIKVTVNRQSIATVLDSDSARTSKSDREEEPEDEEDMEE